jgi:hypothetical protein
MVPKQGFYLGQLNTFNVDAGFTGFAAESQSLVT